MKRDRLLLVSMSVLVALFALRVVLQFLQAIYPIDWLPSFEAWHSGLLPYPLLLATQVCIVYLMSYMLHRARTRRMRARRWKFILCYAFGFPYFLFMAFRWLAGMTFLADSGWFAKPIPAFFHIVLANYLLLLGLHVHGRIRNRKIFSSLPRP